MAALSETAWRIAVREIRGLLLLSLMMTLIAGFLDAVGYTSLGHLYLSFMSGNTTSWGTAVAARNLQVIGWGGAIIATFVVGCIVGFLIAATSGRFRLVCVLGTELLCLASSLGLAASSVGRAGLLPIALAMGMQNAALGVIHGSGSGKTFITGTLVSAGHACAQALLGKGRAAEAGIPFATWLAFVSGVFLGAISVAGLGLNSALVIATATLAVLVLLAWRLSPEPHTTR
jgi:uncharacterized membrane protein YoaK (UPF0700 family)